VAVAQQIIAKDGFGALYKGLSAGLLRQATYTTARMGLFNQFSTTLKVRAAAGWVTSRV
jgi:solute carrier family 25 (mitochondrial oxoglutarate transporter), member 11